MNPGAPHNELYPLPKTVPAVRINSQAFGAKKQLWLLQLEQVLQRAALLGLEVRYRYGKQVPVKPDHFIVHEATAA